MLRKIGRITEFVSLIRKLVKAPYYDMLFHVTDYFYINDRFSRQFDSFLLLYMLASNGDLVPA